MPLCLLVGVSGSGGFGVTSWLRDISVRVGISGKRDLSALGRHMKSKTPVTLNVCCSRSNRV